MVLIELVIFHPDNCSGKLSILTVTYNSYQLANIRTSIIRCGNVELLIAFIILFDFYSPNAERFLVMKLWNVRIWVCKKMIISVLLIWKCLELWVCEMTITYFFFFLMSKGSVGVTRLWNTEFWGCNKTIIPSISVHTKGARLTTFWNKGMVNIWRRRVVRLWKMSLWGCNDNNDDIVKTGIIYSPCACRREEVWG